MTKTSKLKFITAGIGLSFLTLFTISSCRKSFENPEDIQPDKISTHSQTQYVDGAPTVLGAQYVIPFKVSEMQRAKDTLTAKNITPPHNFTVRTTHLYVKFTPANYEQLEILESDTILELSAVPKDYLISVQGSWYRAPGLADTVPNPQYASVQVGFNFPNGIPYQILDSLYVPDEDVQLMTSSPGKAECWYVDRLMAEAHRINTNPILIEFMRMPDDWIEYGGGTYTPPPVHGVIRVWDNRLNQLIPLEGVKVESRRHGWGSKFRYGYTNANGEYSLIGEQLSGTSNYKIEFWRGGFSINDKWLDRYEVKQKDKSRYSFSLDIEGDTYAQFCATMFRAAHRYYHGDVGLLKRPLRYGFAQRLLAKNAYDEDYAGINYPSYPLLKVTRFRNEAETQQYSSDEVYGITIHELAHTAHVLTMDDPLDFNDVSNQIIESWAMAIQWQLVNLEYRSRGITDYGSPTYTVSNLISPHAYGYQFWRGSVTEVYTSLFINLVDNFNELGQSFPGKISGSVDDQVSGYSLSSIQTGHLKNCYSLSNLTSYLKAYKPTGVTNTQIDLLMSFY